MANFLKAMFGNYSKREVKRVQPTADKVLALEDKYAAMSESELKSQTAILKQRLADGETVDDILPDAFAVCREASWRVLGMKHFPVQVIGGIVLHQGRIAEMKTGEGKTLVATLPAYLNGLTGEGVHIVTVNDYLARRDSEWMGKLYKYLGLTVGLIVHDLDNELRKEAYSADITYGTNNELGFDYLRDNMVVYKENKVQRGHTFAIVDEFTGRLMYGRRFNEGLHQAIEAKEGVKVQSESKTLATITFQNYFRLYKKLSGMTGTGETESEEFQEIYKLDVVEIPTNMPVIRKDLPDSVSKTENGKFNAVIDQIVEVHQKGQPVLVGTISIEKSELLSKMLKRRGIAHNVLNAKQHDKEAEIIAQAGKFGAVTIATNMAGRGTDIILGGNAEYMAKASMRKQGYPEEMIEEATGYAETDDEEILEARKVFRELNDKYKEEIKDEADQVREAGGLMIIGTERHESRRIDNQLRGRSGRQGDPGVSRFFLSTEDDLMRLFGGDRMRAMMERMNVDENTPIENKMLTGIIENSQEKVELRNFGIRKDVLQYDDVLNRQREIIYGQRDQVLNGEDLHETVLKMLNDTIDTSVAHYLPEGPKENWNYQSLIEYYKGWIITDDEKYKLDLDDLEDYDADEIGQMIKDDALELFKENEELLPPETIREMERVYLLRAVDTHWMDHIDAMDQLKAGIRLRSYGQHDPVVEYRLEGFDMFDEMIENIREDTVKMMLIMPKRVYEIQKRQEAIEAARKAAEAAAAAAHQVMLNKGEEQEKPNAVQMALKREQVAKPTQTSGDGTDTANKTVRKGKKVGRNDPCPCGSGKKYKKCCGRDA